MYEWEAMFFFYMWLSNILKIYPCPNWPGIFAQKHLAPSTKLNRAPTLAGCWGNEREPLCPPHPGGAHNLAGKTDAWTRNRREDTACWRCLSHTDHRTDLPRRSQQTQCGRRVHRVNTGCHLGGESTKKPAYQESGALNVQLLQGTAILLRAHWAGQVLARAE